MHELNEILHICRPHSRCKSLCGNEKENFQTFLFLLGATSTFERKSATEGTENTEKRSIDVIPAKAGMTINNGLYQVGYDASHQLSLDLIP